MEVSVILFLISFHRCFHIVISSDLRSCWKQTSDICGNRSHKKGMAVKLWPEQRDTCQFSWTLSLLIGDTLSLWKTSMGYTCPLGIASRSQWPRGLGHELSSLARTLGSWVRTPLKAWLSVHLFCVYVVVCVGSGPATGWSLVQGVLSTV
jgi:hypothetical protein